MLTTRLAAALRLLPMTALLLGVVTGRAHAQDETAASASGGERTHESAPRVQTARITGRISLDGQLDEAAWRQTTPATEFIQTEPRDGAAATERTEVYVVYDDDAIYIGARMWDSSGRVKTRLGRRDSMIPDSDWLYLMFDSHHDHLNAYQFSVNPSGVKRDERTSGGVRGDDSWDAIWDVATSIDAEGWTAELRIPFSQLRFSAASEQTWGLQISRRINHKQEVTVLAYTPRTERGGVARYGHLDGLAELKSGRRLELQPYLMSRAEYLDVAAGDPYRDGSDLFGGAGVDLKYRLAPSVTLDATFNPDFGQVELDPAVVNLTAFETSLQEKRPFFMEGSDVFAFGVSGPGGPGGGGPGGGGAGRLFYSRRIGRAPQGGLPSGVKYSDRPDAATILGAAKLTGRTARGLSLGVVGALAAAERADWTGADGSTGAAMVEPRTGFFVARARQDVRRGQTSVGAITTATYRQLDDAALEAALRRSALTGGIDFEHQFFARVWSLDGYATFSHVAGSAASILRTQLASSRYYSRPDADYLSVDSSLTSLQGYAARVAIAKEAGLHWRGGANISAISPGYEINDGGFQTTVDRIGTDANIGYVEQRPGRVFRNYRINATSTADWNFGGDVIIARGSLSVNAQLMNYWGGGLNFTRSIDTWDDRLTRGGPVARDPGGFHMSLNLNSDMRNRFSGRANASMSRGNRGGWMQGMSFNATLRPAGNWTVSIGPRLDRSRSMAQYITAAADPLMTATYGRRFFFSELRQTTASMETRLNLNLTPDLSIELFAQPFVSSGDYGTPAQLRAPRTYEFQRFGVDIGTLHYDSLARVYMVDPDGADGAASTFSISNRDFTTRSLRGNAVLRWEWRAGSTLYFVWQQRRAGGDGDGRLDLRNDVGGVFREKPQNVFVLKLNYWLNL